MFLMVFSSSLVALALGAGPVGGGLQSGAAASSQEQTATPAQEQPDAATSRAHNDSFIIGNNDMLAISVWKEPDLTKTDSSAIGREDFDAFGGRGTGGGTNPSST